MAGGGSSFVGDLAPALVVSSGENGVDIDAAPGSAFCDLRPGAVIPTGVFSSTSSSQVRGYELVGAMGGGPDSQCTDSGLVRRGVAAVGVRGTLGPESKLAFGEVGARLAAASLAGVVVGPLVGAPVRKLVGGPTCIALVRFGGGGGSGSTLAGCAGSGRGGVDGGVSPPITEKLANIPMNPVRGARSGGSPIPLIAGDRGGLVTSTFTFGTLSSASLNASAPGECDRERTPACVRDTPGVLACEGGTIGDRCACVVRA